MRCPECDSADVAEIVYGLVNPDDPDSGRSWMKARWFWAGAAYSTMLPATNAMRALIAGRNRNLNWSNILRKMCRRGCLVDMQRRGALRVRDGGRQAWWAAAQVLRLV